MAQDVKDFARKEVISLRRVVKGSKLGKHISEDILIPILERLDPMIDLILDWIGWYIQEEIKHVLATSKSSGGTYEVYYVDPGAAWGQKYTKIGEYTASAEGGPPHSPDSMEDPDIPPSGTLLQSITYEIRGSSVVLGIKHKVTPYHLYFKYGKLFVGEDTEPRSASVYGSILDDPAYDHYRPYFTQTIRQMKGKIKKQFREVFKKEVQTATKRPTVRRAIEIHFRWIGNE